MVGSVPYANPDSVASAPPVAEIDPFKVAVDVLTELAAEVVTEPDHNY